MGHITSKSYYDLQQRLNQSPQGAPASESLFKILEILFTKEEAELVSKLPIKPLTVKKAAKIWGKSEFVSRKILNTLADKGLLLDMRNGNKQTYVLAPTMAGFFEFSLMRTDGLFDREILSKLFYQYINVEDRFLKEVLALKPSIVRTFVHEDRLLPKHQSIILDYERASHIIKSATCITVGTCYCRHKMEHVGKACNMPQDVCLTFNNAAKSLSEHGIAKKITKKEGLEILDKCVKLGLVQIGDNVQDGVSFICNCCSCCCEAILAYKKLGHMRINTNFFADLHKKNCSGCGVCAKKCPVDAISMVVGKYDKKYAEINIDVCIGCGVCTRFCPTKSLVMDRRKETMFVPKDSFERFVITAIETGKLQNLIFDNYSLWTNEVMRNFLKIILSLKPAKRMLATRQLQSRFINRLSKTYFAVAKPFVKGQIEIRDYSHPEMNWNK